MLIFSCDETLRPPNKLFIEFQKLICTYPGACICDKYVNQKFDRIISPMNLYYEQNFIKIQIDVSPMKNQVFNFLASSYVFVKRNKIVAVVLDSICTVEKQLHVVTPLIRLSRRAFVA